MQNLNLVTQHHMMQQDLDQSPQAMPPTTENSSNNQLHEGFQHQDMSQYASSQARGDSGTVKRAVYNKTNTVKRGTSGNTKKNSMR